MCCSSPRSWIVTCFFFPFFFIRSLKTRNLLNISKVYDTWCLHTWHWDRWPHFSTACSVSSLAPPCSCWSSSPPPWAWPRVSSHWPPALWSHSSFSLIHSAPTLTLCWSAPPCRHCDSGTCNLAPLMMCWSCKYTYLGLWISGESVEKSVDFSLINPSKRHICDMITEEWERNFGYLRFLGRFWSCTSSNLNFSF